MQHRGRHIRSICLVFFSQCLLTFSPNYTDNKKLATEMRPSHLLALPVAAAQINHSPGQAPIWGLSGPDRNPSRERGLPEEIWTAAFVSPNATGSSSISGRDITLPFPGRESPDWNYTLSIRDDVPAPEGDGFMSAAWLKLEAPEGIFAERGMDDASWEVCTMVFTGPGMVGGCDQVLSDVCERELREVLERAFGNETAGCPFPRRQIAPESCGWVNGTVGVSGGESVY